MATHTTDPRIDAYIDHAAPFAQPILRHLRELLHRHCPELVETIKWSSPFFDYHGHPLCNMAAFKQHCAFGFWRSEDLDGATDANAQARSDFGRLTDIGQLPGEAELAVLVQRAMALIDSGQPHLARKNPREPKAPLETPDDLAAALNAHPQARTRFETFSPSQRREYIEWIVEAKRPATREKRLLQTVDQLAEGKPLNWKYGA